MDRLVGVFLVFLLFAIVFSIPACNLGKSGRWWNESELGYANGHHYAASTQTEGGWIVVGKPAATLTQSGNNQSGSAGTALLQPQTVTLAPAQSGISVSGGCILFSTSAGKLSNGTTTGTSVIAQTNSSGTDSVTLTMFRRKER